MCSHGSLADVEDWDTGVRKAAGEVLCDHLWIGIGSERKGRSSQFYNYRAGDETGDACRDWDMGQSDKWGKGWSLCAAQMLAEGKECSIGVLLRSRGWDWGVEWGNRERRVCESPLGSGRCGCGLGGMPAGVRDWDPATSREEEGPVYGYTGDVGRSGRLQRPYTRNKL